MHVHASFFGLWSPDGMSEHSVPFSGLIGPVDNISGSSCINTSVILLLLRIRIRLIRRLYGLRIERLDCIARGE